MEKEKLLVFGNEQLKKDYIDRTLTSIEIEPSEYDSVIKPPEGYNGFKEIIVKGARLQQKLVTPTKEMQQIFADEGYYGLSDVIVSATPFNNDDIKEMLTDGANATANDIKLGKTAYVSGELITGNLEISGTLNITNNGEYDVVNYEKVNVEIHPSGTLNITDNGEYDVSDYANVNVQTGSKLKTLLDATKSTKYLFYEYSGTSVDDLISYDDTENVENMNMMFSTSKITTQPSLNMSNVKDTSYMYSNSTLITAVIDASNVETANMMFQNCKSLKTVIFSHTFQPKNPNAMFYGCISLITVESLNFINATYDNNIFYNCKNLTNLKILNLKFNLQVGSGSSYGHLLTLESLIGLCQECVNVNASRTLTIGTTNKNKLSNIYVKLTGEPEEDETLPKIPMVQCESTDEGAMLISEYMTLKNWTLG